MVAPPDAYGDAVQQLAHKRDVLELAAKRQRSVHTGGEEAVRRWPGLRSERQGNRPVRNSCSSALVKGSQLLCTKQRNAPEICSSLADHAVALCAAAAAAGMLRSWGGPSLRHFAIRIWIRNLTIPA